ncbi:MAG: hypothetical protein ACRDYB_01975 [Acidimicrobiales bacterium]
MSRTLEVAAFAAAGAFSRWEGGLGQATVAAHAGVLVAIGLAIGAAVLVGRGRQPLRSRQWAAGPLAVRRHYAGAPAATLASVIWVVLLLAVVGWDLNSFVHQHHDLPTLSSIFGHVTDSRPGRAGLVAVWLALGAALATGWRKKR